MNKVSFYRCLLPFLAFLLITPLAAQNDPGNGGIINGGKILDLEEDDKIITANEDCNAYFTIRVKVVNFYFTPDNPNNYPPMFVSYKIDQIAHTPIPVSFDNFQQSDDPNYWTWTHEVTVDVYDYCQEEVEAISLELELLTLEDNVYFAYPVDDFATPTDLFSCETFDETCEVCPPENGGCAFPPSRNVIYEEELGLECENCLGNNPPNSSNEDPPGRSSSNSSSAAFDLVQISPNPFSDYLQINAFSAETAISVRIFSAAGQELFSDTGSTLIRTENWLPGIYFIEMTVAGERRVERLLKIE